MPAGYPPTPAPPQVPRGGVLQWLTTGAGIVTTLVGAALVGVLIAAGVVWTTGDGSSGGAGDPQSATARFHAARTPEDIVAASVQVMLTQYSFASEMDADFGSESLGGLGVSDTAAASYYQDGRSLAETIDPFAGPKETLFDGEQIFIRFLYFEPGFQDAADHAGLAEGVWYRVPDDEDPGAVVISALTSDPQRTLDLRMASTTDVREAGTDEIDGVPVRGYEVTVDVQRFLRGTLDQLIDYLEMRGMSAEAQQTREDTDELLAAIAAGEMPLFGDLDELTSTMWIDDDGLIRAEDSVRGRMRHYDFGADFDLPVLDAATTPVLPD